MRRAHWWVDDKWRWRPDGCPSVQRELRASLGVVSAHKVSPRLHVSSLGQTERTYPGPIRPRRRTSLLPLRNPPREPAASVPARDLSTMPCARAPVLATTPRPHRSVGHMIPICNYSNSSAVPPSHAFLPLRQCSNCSACGSTANFVPKREASPSHQRGGPLPTIRFQGSSRPSLLITIEAEPQASEPSMGLISSKPTLLTPCMRETQFCPKCGVCRGGLVQVALRRPPSSS